MTARVFTATVVCVVSAGAFAGTAAADPPTGTNANGCVGALLSNAAHYWAADDSVKGGFGAQAKFLEVNAGEAIQAAATAVCGKHQ